jgi:hypothetical protein
MCAGNSNGLLPVGPRLGNSIASINTSQSEAICYSEQAQGAFNRAWLSCRPHTEQFVDLSKIADRFHVATVHSEDESLFRRDNSHEPLPAWRKCAWNGSQAAVGFRQDAHESNNIGA